MAVKQNRILCYNPRTKQYSPVQVSEVLLCVDIELGNDTERGVQLTEQPSFDFTNYPVQITRDSDSQVFTETVSDSIGATEFLVDYTTGSGNIILNSSTSVGESFTVNYYSIGSINTIQNILNSGSLAELGDLLAGSRKIQNLVDGSIVNGGKDSITAGQLYTEQQARSSEDSSLQSQISGNDTDISTINSSKGQPNGIATLDSSGYLDQPVSIGNVIDTSGAKRISTEFISGLSGSIGNYAWSRSGRLLVTAVLANTDNLYFNMFRQDQEGAIEFFRYNNALQQFEWKLFSYISSITIYYIQT